jgi:ABC-type bacteriocin/lantibiotic exporter with double-glycine peptidase domain
MRSLAGDGRFVCCCVLSNVTARPSAGSKRRPRIFRKLLRTALKTSAEGSFVSHIPNVLRDFGLPHEYFYHNNLTIDDLRMAVRFRPAIAIVRDKLNRVHALIVEEVSENQVAIRDPLPVGSGSAYRVKLPLFLESWVDRKSGYGIAVTVLE